MKSRLSLFEFIFLTALLMSFIPISIDVVIPSLSLISKSLNIDNSKDAQLIISIVFLGLAIGQLLFGILSDSIGRKKAILIGLVFFIVGCIISFYSTTLVQMLLGRFLQGFGASASRILTVAMIRDKYTGNMMASVLSYTTMLFMAFPIIFMLIGQRLVTIWTWKILFIWLILLSLIAFSWLFLRQKETLLKEKSIVLSWRNINVSFKLIWSHQETKKYTFLLALTMSVLISFLSTIEQVLYDIYGVTENFIFYYSLVSLPLGIASLINAKLVNYFNIKQLVKVSFLMILIVTFIFTILQYLWFHDSSLIGFIGYLCLVLFCLGFLLANITSLAIEPLEKNIGMGSTFIGFLSTFIGLFLSILIGYMYNYSTYPILFSFFFLSIFGLYFNQKNK